MVSSLLVDALSDPTKVLLGLYSPENVSDFASAVKTHFADVFASTAAFQQVGPPCVALHTSPMSCMCQIPVLDVAHPPECHTPRSLVRFRAMVQDTSGDAEMFLSKLPDGTPGGWGIESDTAENGQEPVNYEDLRECQVLWAVSIPGESDWCARELDGELGTLVPRCALRSRLMFLSLRSIAGLGFVDKDLPPTQIPAFGHATHWRTGQGERIIGIFSEESALIRRVQVYDTSLVDSLKPTDCATFVGILTHEPSACLPLGSPSRSIPSSISDDIDQENPIEVPTLHILFARPLPAGLVSRPFGVAPAPESARTRAELIEWLAEEALGGDADAAEWLLLAYLGRV
jgi:hypothetical protein